MAPHEFTEIEKRSRLTFALNNLDNNFQNVVFVDESSCWTLRPGLYCNRRPSIRPKCNAVFLNHSKKVHIWSGISWNGPVPPVVF